MCIETAEITIHRKAIKHLYLRIGKRGEIVVSAPKHLPEQAIYQFVAEKAAWIEKKRQTLKQASAEDENTLVLFGKRYRIQRHFGKKPDIDLSDNCCHIHLTDDKRSAEEKLIVALYRSQLMPVVEDWVTHYAPILGVRPNEIRSKNMKTKWGSCNVSAKRLWFNVQLARFSHRHIAYVVVHELAHLRERRHNKRFYAIVAEAMPDWRRYHAVLR